MAKPCMDVSQDHSRYEEYSYTGYRGYYMIKDGDFWRTAAVFILLNGVKNS